MNPAGSFRARVRLVRTASRVLVGAGLVAIFLDGSRVAAQTADTTSPIPVEVGPRAPMPPPAYMETVLGLLRQGRYGEARHMLEPVVASHPRWARAQFYMALTYHKEHRYEAALPLFDLALELDPEYAPPRLYLGWCLYYLGEAERSRAMFESFLATRPDYADAIYALGLLDLDADAVAEARARFERAAQLAAAEKDAETEAKSRARLADVDLREGNLESARQQLVRSIALEPDNYEPYFKLSLVLDRLGDAEGAARARERHEAVRAAKRPQATPPTPEKP